MSTWPSMLMHTKFQIKQAFFFSFTIIQLVWYWSHAISKTFMKDFCQSDQKHCKEYERVCLCLCVLRFDLVSNIYTNMQSN